MSSLVVGLEDLGAGAGGSYANVLKIAQEDGFAFSIFPITRDAVASRLLFDPRECTLEDLEKWQAAPVFKPADLYIDGPNEVNDQVVGEVGSFIQFDCFDENILLNHKLCFLQQLGWASHVGLKAVLTSMPATREGITQFARIYNEALELYTFSTPLWLRVTLSSVHNDPVDYFWKGWDLLRAYSTNTTKMMIALELDADLPQGSRLQRWRAEPVQLVVLPTSIFLTNAKGYPVLSKPHQDFLKYYLSQGTPMLIKNDTNVRIGIGAYKEFLSYLSSSLPDPPLVERFAIGYQDYLQSPLQPLMNNLEASTYHVFELDPIKYVQYEEAIYQALIDKKELEDRVMVILVAGAGGRGPLVNCSIKAAARANCLVHIYALEKNPNAIVTLQQQQEKEWRDLVTLVHGDMREWQSPEEMDLIVSELLGSFGDNELSPECLDGAQRHLRPDGVFIPSSYSSYISPMSSFKLHNDVGAYQDVKSFETPWVVMFKSVYEMTKSQPTWTFNHPLTHSDGTIRDPPPAHNLHNQRHSRNVFTVDCNLTMHGIAGYFDAQLYKDVSISINPESHSPDLFSWFPIFFPLMTPLLIPANSHIVTNFWRMCDRRRVWYEWAVEVYQSSSAGGDGENRWIRTAASTIHNPRGRSSWLGL